MTRANAGLCNVCGTEVVPGARWCHWCAAPISDDAIKEASESAIVRGFFVLMFVLGLGMQFFGQAGFGVAFLGWLVWIFWDLNRKDYW